MADLPSFELVLSAEERTSVKTSLAKAIVAFQDELLRDVHQHGGSLCQVWLPDLTEDGSIHLKTKDLPFCVAGTGDLLALFRCISSRYSFATDVRSPSKLGAPGRVFLSSEPEASRNVQKYSKEVYLRSAGAQQCNIHSTLLVPLFRDADCSKTVGVLEVVQNTEDMQFGGLITTLNRALSRFGLYTHDPNNPRLSRSISQQSGEVPDHPPAPAPVPALRDLGTLVQEVDAPVVTLENSTTSLEKLRLADDGADAVTSIRDHTPQQPHEVGVSPEAGGGGRGGDGDAGDGGDSDEPGGHTARKGGSKTGRNLSLEDLQSQFGVGLREAAQRLGICPTTLKRACRRHGIQRWPRRQLLKISKAIDQIQASTSGQDAQLLAVQGIEAKETLATAKAQGAVAPDDRWTCLAQLIPGISNPQGPIYRAASNRSQSGDTPPLTLARTPPGQHVNGGYVPQHGSLPTGFVMPPPVVGSFSSNRPKVGEGMHTPQVAYTGTAMMGGGAVVGAVYTGDAGAPFPTELEHEYQQWKASTHAYGGYNAHSAAMQYGRPGVPMSGQMQQPMMVATPTLDHMTSGLTPGLTPGLDMAFEADHAFDAPGAVDDFYAADPEVLSLIAAD